MKDGGRFNLHIFIIVLLIIAAAFLFTLKSSLTPSGFFFLQDFFGNDGQVIEDGGDVEGCNSLNCPPEDYEVVDWCDVEEEGCILYCSDDVWNFPTANVVYGDSDYNENCEYYQRRSVYPGLEPGSRIMYENPSCDFGAGMGYTSSDDVAEKGLFPQEGVNIELDRVGSNLIQEKLNVPGLPEFTLRQGEGRKVIAEFSFNGAGPEYSYDCQNVGGTVVYCSTSMQFVLTRESFVRVLSNGNTIYKFSVLSSSLDHFSSAVYTAKTDSIPPSLCIKGDRQYVHREVGGEELKKTKDLGRMAINHEITNSYNSCNLGVPSNMNPFPVIFVGTQKFSVKDKGNVEATASAEATCLGFTRFCSDLSPSYDVGGIGTLKTEYEKMKKIFLEKSARDLSPSFFCDFSQFT